MKRIALLGLLLSMLSAAPSVFAQNEPKVNEPEQGPPQGAPQEEVPFTVPDIRTLYPLEKSFWVLRNEKVTRLTEKDAKEKGDLQLMWSQSFSRDENSKDIIAGAVYPLDKTEHCVLRWVEKNASELFGLVFENGKMFVWPGSRGIGYYVLARIDQPNAIMGIRIYLMDGNGKQLQLKDEQGKPLQLLDEQRQPIVFYRDFMISVPPPDIDTDKVTM